MFLQICVLRWFMAQKLMKKFAEDIGMVYAIKHLTAP